MIVPSDKSVRSVIPPPTLSEADRAEFLVLQRSLSVLEDQWHHLHDAPTSDCVDYSAIFDREFGARLKQAEIIEQIEIEDVEKEFREESDRMAREFEENQKTLFKRFVRGYYVSYQRILDHLRELLGPDYETYQQANEIEFPDLPSVKNQETKLPQPEEPKIAFSPHETDRQLREIRQTVHDQSLIPSEVEEPEPE
jgi:hypothetical protein